MKRLFCCLLAFCLLLMPMALADNPLYAASIPADTKVIEEEAFCGDTGFTVAYLPDGLQRIEKRAFADTNLRVINLPSTLEYVAPDAFEGCFSTLLAIVEKGSAQHSMAMECGVIPCWDFSYALLLSEADEAGNEFISSVEMFSGRSESMIYGTVDGVGVVPTCTTYSTNGGSVSELIGYVDRAVADGAEFLFVQSESAEEAAEIGAYIDSKGIPFIFFGEDPGASVAKSFDCLYVASMSGTENYADRVAYAIPNIALNYLLSNYWTSGTIYSKADDGYSVRIAGENDVPYYIYVASPDTGSTLTQKVRSQMNYLLEQAELYYDVSLNGRDTAAGQLELVNAISADHCDLMIMELVSDEYAADVSKVLADKGIAALFYSVDPGKVIDDSALFVGMTAGSGLDSEKLSEAVAEIAMNYVLNGDWLTGTDYALAADGYSVRIEPDKVDGSSGVPTVGILISDSSYGLNAYMTEYMYVYAYEVFDEEPTMTKMDSKGSAEMQYVQAETLVDNGIDIAVIQLADASLATAIEGIFTKADIPCVFVQVDPTDAINESMSIFIGMADGADFDTNEVAKAAASIVMHRQHTGEWLKDTGYTYAEDGYSVRVG